MHLITTENYCRLFLLYALLVAVATAAVGGCDLHQRQLVSLLLLSDGAGIHYLISCLHAGFEDCC